MATHLISRAERVTQDKTKVSELIAQLGPEHKMEHRAKAAAQLRTLAATGQTRVVIAQQGGIEALVELAWHGTEQARERAANALGNLALTAQNCPLIADAGGIGPLVDLSLRGTLLAQGKANEALDRFRKHKKCKQIIEEETAHLLKVMKREANEKKVEDQRKTDEPAQAAALTVQPDDSDWVPPPPPPPSQLYEFQDAGGAWRGPYDEATLNGWIAQGYVFEKVREFNI